VAVDMAECRLDFETMHHGQRNRQALRGSHFRAMAIFGRYPCHRSGAGRDIENDRVWTEIARCRWPLEVYEPDHTVPTSPALQFICA